MKKNTLPLLPIIEDDLVSTDTEWGNGLVTSPTEVTPDPYPDDIDEDNPDDDSSSSGGVIGEPTRPYRVKVNAEGEFEEWTILGSTPDDAARYVRSIPGMLPISVSDFGDNSF